MKNFSFFWDKKTVTEQEERHSDSTDTDWSSQKPVAMLQRRTGKNGLQRENKTGNCGGREKRKKTKPQKLLFLPFYFSSFALGLSNFSYKDIRDKKNEGKRKEIAYLLSLKNNNKKSYLKSS